MNRTQRLTAKDGFVRGQQPGTTLARRSLLGAVGVGLFVMVVLTQFGDNGVFALFKLQSREAILRDQVADLQLQQDELGQRLTALAAEDQGALEKLAREKYNMQKPDERVLLILPPAAE